MFDSTAVPGTAGATTTLLLDGSGAAGVEGEPVGSTARAGLADFLAVARGIGVARALAESIRLPVRQRRTGFMHAQKSLALLAALAAGCRSARDGDFVLAPDPVAPAALDEALAFAQETGERWWLAKVHRLQGELLLLATPRAGNADDRAAARFLQALAVAREQQARSLELRAAMSLARLWQRQGRRGEARELLAPIYGWFTEGFDTPDLREAKAVLEALP